MKNPRARVPDKEHVRLSNTNKNSKDRTAPDIKNSFVFKMKIAKHEVQMGFEVSFV